MYKTRNNYRDGRYNSRNGYSSSNNDNRSIYRGYGHNEREMYEDDRYHMSRRNRLNEENDYGQFSNIYDNDPYRRGDFDTRYNDKRNYYYDNGPENDRSHEARGQSLRDIFRGGRERRDSDRDYFTSYRRGSDYNSDPQYSLYGSEDSASYNRNHYYNDRNDRYDSDEDYYRNMRDYPDRRKDSSYNGYSTGYERRRRYNEGYLY